MKKIVLTAVVVVIAAVAAQAQSPRTEVLMADASFRGATLKRNAEKTSKKIAPMNAVIERTVIQQVERAKSNQAQKAAPQKPKTNGAPQKAAAKPNGKKDASQQPAANQEKKKSRVSQWLKSILFSNRYPGETEKQYQTRLLAQSQPAALPFK